MKGHIQTQVLVILAVGTVSDRTLSNLLQIKETNLQCYLRRWCQQGLIRRVSPFRPYVYQIDTNGMEALKSLSHRRRKQIAKEIVQS